MRRSSAAACSAPPPRTISSRPAPARSSSIARTPAAPPTPAPASCRPRPAAAIPKRGFAWPWRPSITIRRSSSGCRASRPATPDTRAAASWSSRCPTTSWSRSLGPGASSSSASARGLPKPADLHEIGDAEARELFPPLARVRAAIYSRVAARVDGRLLNRALLAAAGHRGLVVRAGSVERLTIDGDAVSGLVADGETIAAGVVAIAGGAWSEAFAGQLGVTIPVAPQRGQIIHLGLRGVDTRAWPMVSAFHEQYMVAWPDSRVVAGATRETGSGFAPHTTTAGVRAVLDEALRVAPGLAAAEIREIRVGLRPLTPDLLPVLGAVPGIRNIFLVTGHGPTGLTLGPYSAKLVAGSMLGQPPQTDVRPFSVARFAAARPA